MTGLEAAQQAGAAGHAAIVLKSHDTPSAGLAAALDPIVDGVAVFGGICCDHEIGGMNPAAVEVALRLGARIVWLPTLSSAQDVANGVAAQLGIPGPGLRVTDADGGLTPETLEVLDLVAEFDAVLATGHVSADEHLAVTQRVRRARQGPRDPRHGGAGRPQPRRGPVRRAGRARRAHRAVRAHLRRRAGDPPVADLVACIRRVGVEHVTLGTDFGQGVNEPPAAGLQTFADALFAAGLTETEIRRMACTNPNALLGPRRLSTSAFRSGPGRGTPRPAHDRAVEPGRPSSGGSAQ